MKRLIGTTGLSLLLIQGLTRADDWPMLGHDAARSGGTAEEVGPPFARKWYRLFPDEGIQTGVQPVIAEGKVFLGTLRGVLHAIDNETGKDSWTYQVPGPILHSAAADQGRVFFGSADGCVYGLTLDGKLSWSLQTGSAVWNAPAIYQGIVFVGSRDGTFYGIDAATGKVRWSSNLHAPILNSPAVDGRAGRVYVGSENMRVHAFAVGNGRPVWTSEPLPGSTMRGYHPVIAPDGAVMVTTAPVIGYDRFQELLLEMVREVFGDFASWRHKKDENDKLRAENFRLMEKPETYKAQLEFLRQRLQADPQFQTFFVLDPETGKQRFVTPVVASESMNGPGAPPLVTADGKVIVKYQALLRSRYEHYSPFLNVGYLDTVTGRIDPIMDQTRTYGWHDSLLLVHDEQCQLSLSGHILFNTHQDNVNAMDLQTLKGFTQPFALNVHEPAAGEAVAIRMAAWRGDVLPPGEEWLIRGTAVCGGGSVLDVPVSIAGDSFYYLPTHEINSGCALIAYKMTSSAPEMKRTLPKQAPVSDEEWKLMQEMAWDWDTLSTPRLTNFLAALPGPVPGSAALPLWDEAKAQTQKIPEAELDRAIREPAFDPSDPVRISGDSNLAGQISKAVTELIGTRWRPLLMPAAKAPEHAYRFFNDPSQTIYSLMLARPCVTPQLQKKIDAHISRMLDGAGWQPYAPDTAEPRELYRTGGRMQVVDERVLDPLERCYALWLWSKTEAGARFASNTWGEVRAAIKTPAPRQVDDCGNARLAGLIGYCRLARTVRDKAALDEALPLTKSAMRERLDYELAHTRGGLIRVLPPGRSVFARWRHLTPDVARFIGTHAKEVEERLMSSYVDDLRPGWWLAWNAEQMMRNEAPYQLPTTPLEIFTARALLLQRTQTDLQKYIDLPWSKGDEFYIQKLALTIRAP